VPGVRWLVAGIIGGALGCSFLARLLAPDDFPSLGVAFWWAIQTVTTVGYGDTVPRSSHGKFIAAVLMVAAVATISLVTASVSAAWVSRAQTRRQAEHRDPVLEALARIERRLDELEPRSRRG
jgi:voltage-gated potassium channel